MLRFTFFISLFLILESSQLYAREFLNTYLHLNFGGMHSAFLSGDSLKKEESLANSHFSDISTMTHHEAGFFITLDLVPMDPIVLGLEAHAIKLGLRGSYGFYFFEQRIISNDKEYENQLMDYSAWMIGPVLYYAPYLEASDFNLEYTANSGFTFFALYGHLNGKMGAGKSIIQAGGSVPNNESDVSGYKINIGMGAELAVCSLNLGVNFYYSHIHVKLDRAIYPNIGRDTSFNELAMELYVGIPIESFIEPLVPRF